MSELKPCPFCGGSEILITRHPGAGNGIYHRGEDVYSMCCYQCGATFPNRYRRELLVEAWNRRTPSLPASAEGGEAIDFVQELYSELRHQVNNCPVCKGEGMAVDVFDVLTKPEPREKTPCNRCSRARSLLDRVKPARTTLSEAKTHG